ncbi:MAG: cell division protein ZapA [Bdellovibrionales bacterium]|nr:cell division protein ZapA [Bdellovibrionales bacterium]
MQQEPKTYEVEIAGVPLRLKASHDQETVNEILKMVENQMDPKLAKTSLRNSALLACLRLAEELYTLKQRTKEELDNLESRTLEQISQIQQVPQQQ